MFDNILKKETYDLLQSLMKDKFFNDFFLVGGTALALQLSHRESIDLDLFTANNINIDKLKKHLIDKYKFEPNYEEKNTLKGYIGDILIDCIKYDYNLIMPLKNINGIRMLSLEDIIPMKLQAIIANGSRLKDFIDIGYLSEYFSLNKMIKLYKKKYGINNEIIIMKAIVYFNDINFKEKIKINDKRYKWEIIKNRIIAIVNDPEKTFGSLYK